MRVLAIDTSHKIGSVSAGVDGDVKGTITFGAESSHLVEFSGAIREVARLCAIELADFDRVAIVSGPGSFTGLRIGMSYAKGLFAAHRMEIVTITSLELLALQTAGGDIPICPMIDARKNEVYTALFSDDPAARKGDRTPTRLDPDIPQQAADPATFLQSLQHVPTRFVGSGAVSYRALIEDVFGDEARLDGSDTVHAPSTAVLSRIVTARVPVPADEVPQLEPVYIRPVDAKLSKLRKVRTHD